MYILLRAGHHLEVEDIVVMLETIHHKLGSILPTSPSYSRYSSLCHKKGKVDGNDCKQTLLLNNMTTQFRTIIHT